MYRGPLRLCSLVSMERRIRLPKGVWSVFLVVILSIAVACFVLMLTPKSKSFDLKAMKPKKAPQSKLKILIWPQGASMRDPMGGTAFQSCPVFRNCMYTRNRDFLNVSKAVYFMTSRLRSLRNDMPAQHRADQFWVLHSQEPDHEMLPWHEHFYDTFNVMVSDRPDADIRFGNGQLRPINAESVRLYESRYRNANFTHGKYGNFIAASISTCDSQSKAEQYLTELRKFLPVDVYGRCDEPGQARAQLLRGQEPDMKIPLSMQRMQGYKFFLAFENSICPYHVTNKLWWPIVTGVVPVVLGGANYTDLLPEHSYIDVKDFRSPKMLAEYIIQVNKNYKLYQAYFKWKSYYTFNARYDLPCRLCNFLNIKRTPSKKYRDLRNWLTTCQNPLEYYNGTSTSVIERIKTLQAGS